MASQCPRCHKTLANDTVCCANLRATWKCKSCGKLTTGFALPYGRCFLCGGAIETVKGYKADDVKALQAVEEAVQFELDAFHFYRLAHARATNPKMKALFEQMYLKEQDHIEELEKKYHVHLDPEILTLTPNADELLSKDLFRGVDFSDREGQVEKMYEKAIAMEKKTRDHFQKRASELPPGPEKEIYRELAAEEVEHVAILETELEQIGR